VATITTVKVFIIQASNQKSYPFFEKFDMLDVSLKNVNQHSVILRVE
jgi:hypothetical protein